MGIVSHVYTFDADVYLLQSYLAVNLRELCKLINEMYNYGP